MNKSTFLKDTIIYSITGVIVKASSFLIIPFLTRNLSIKEYGSLELLITIYSLLIPIFMLNINEGQLRFGIEEGDLYKKLSIISSTYSLLKFPVILIIIGNIILFTVSLFFQSLNNSFYLVFSLAIVFEAVKIIFLNSFRVLNNFFTFFLSELIFSFSFVLLIIVSSTYFDMNKMSYFYCIICSNFLSLIFLYTMRKINKYDLGKSDKIIKRNILLFSLPLIPNTILWWVVATSDRLIVTYFLGVAATGIFSVAMKIPSMFSVMYSFVLKGWQNQLYGSSSLIDLKRKSKIFVFILSLIFIIVYLFSLLFGKEVISVLFGEKYISSYTIFPTLVLSSYFMCMTSFLGAELMKMKKTKFILYSSLISATLNIAFNVTLIPLLGLSGAAYSTLTASLVLVYLRLIKIQLIDMKKTLFLITFILYVSNFFIL